MWVGEYDKQTIACHMSVVFENLGTVNRALEEYVDRDKDYAILDRLMEQAFHRLEEIEDILDLWKKPGFTWASLDRGQFDSLKRCDCPDCREDSSYRMD
jgi:hypothetical protein